MVTPESARRVMETYSAADLSADRNEPVDLPLTNETISGKSPRDYYEAKRRHPRREFRIHVMKEDPPRASASPLSAPGASGCSAARWRRAIRRWNGSASPRTTPTAAAKSARGIGADFVTTAIVELLARPEVTARSSATDEHLHVDPIMAAVERGVPMLIEKPLATDLAQSARVLKAIKDAKLDAVVGYTQRFRRKWLAPRKGAAPARSAT